MVQISIDINKENIRLEHLGKDVRKSVLSDAAQDMTRFLQRNSPRDHGLLASWFIESMDENEAHIKSPAFYAIYQDQGTRPYTIYPKGIATYHAGMKLTSGSALWWPGAKHPVRKVNHPGIKGKHFVEKSFNQVKPRFGGYLAKALERSG